MVGRRVKRDKLADCPDDLGVAECVNEQGLDYVHMGVSGVSL